MGQSTARVGYTPKEEAIDKPRWTRDLCVLLFLPSSYIFQQPLAVLSLPVLRMSENESHFPGTDSSQELYDGSDFDDSDSESSTSTIKAHSSQTEDTLPPTEVEASTHGSFPDLPDGYDQAFQSAVTECKNSLFGEGGLCMPVRWHGKVADTIGKAKREIAMTSGVMSVSIAGGHTWSIFLRPGFDDDDETPSDNTYRLAIGSEFSNPAEEEPVALADVTLVINLSSSSKQVDLEVKSFEATLDDAEDDDEKTLGRLKQLAIDLGEEGTVGPDRFLRALEDLSLQETVRKL